MTAAEIETASKLCRGWMFMAVPMVAICFSGKLSDKEVYLRVNRLYARHALN